MRILVVLISFTIVFGCQKIDNKGNKDSNQIQQELLNKEELENKNLKELRIIRNEIFARYGYIFKSEDLTNYFSKFDWYNPQYDNVNDKLSEIDKKNIDLIFSIENEIKSMPFDKKIIGQWTNKVYINSLTNTKSQRISQAIKYLTFVLLKEDTKSFIALNFHEGVNTEYFIEKNMVKFKDHYLDNTYAELIDFNTLLFCFQGTNDTLIRYEITDTLGNNLAINKIIFEGKYKNLKNNELIEFKLNGELTGIENYTNYMPFEDYIGPGLDVDLLRLKNSEKDTLITWDFSNDTLNLYSYKCVEFDTIGDYCVTIDKGNILYKLKRIE